ncbi:MAG: hypothetical protein ACI8XB_002173 [Patiriisocius sp.]|jgi:hypothetical protein
METLDSKLIENPLNQISGTYVVDDSHPYPNPNFMLDITEQRFADSVEGSTLTVSVLDKETIKIETNINLRRTYLRSYWMDGFQFSC